MDPRHLEELRALEDGYWWHVAKRELVLEVLHRWRPPPGVLIEGGVGAGGNLVAFQQAGYAVTGFDLMEEAILHCRQRGVAQAHVHDLGQPWPVPTESADVVVLLDVLEHVADPSEVLRLAAATLKPDGCFVITVPAGPWLMGPWDRMLGHYRRYTRRMLRDHAAAAGLRLSWCSYWNSFTLPAAVVIRTLERFSARERSAEFPRVGPWVNRRLIGLARIERRVMRRMRVPCGLSLLGVLHK